MTLLATLDDRQRSLAARPFTDDAARRWLEYRPAQRPGACIAEMSGAARKAAHRLLATGLSDHAYAQAMAAIALEEVLDRRERWLWGRHSGDYWVSVFGDPVGGDPWSWRFEGHHLSVTMTLAGGEISPAPVFLGANPACVSHAGRPVSRPLAPEEDLARALIDALGPAGRDLAVVAGQAPGDIRSQQLGRLHLCAADDCTNVHIDLSKNRSRRFCSTSCANRTNVAAYRTRRATRPTPS